MRINVYSQELTDEVIAVSKVSNTGIEYKAIQFVLHSSPMLHHPPADDDPSDDVLAGLGAGPAYTNVSRDLVNAVPQKLESIMSENHP